MSTIVILNSIEDKSWMSNDYTDGHTIVTSRADHLLTIIVLDLILSSPEFATPHPGAIVLCTSYGRHLKTSSVILVPSTSHRFVFGDGSFTSSLIYIDFCRRNRGTITLILITAATLASLP
mmetsp:Transcript_23471/g.50698  ORF Transcript_23471/g.50698 Transcript_23471/m.50698 type:complete len:121 (-) Transcript_23471:1151-1513(-)